MKKTLTHILRLIVCLLFIGSSSSCQRGILPKDKVFDIIEQMYDCDVRLAMYDQYKDLADSTFVYESIFIANNTDSATFFRSINHYLDRPMKFRSALNRHKLELADRRKALVELVKTGREKRLEVERFSQRLLDSTVSPHNRLRDLALRRIIFPQLYGEQPLRPPFAAKKSSSQNTLAQNTLADSLRPANTRSAEFWAIECLPTFAEEGVPMLLSPLEITVAGVRTAPPFKRKALDNINVRVRESNVIKEETFGKIDEKAPNNPNIPTRKEEQLEIIEGSL